MKPHKFEHFKQQLSQANQPEGLADPPGPIKEACRFHSLVERLSPKAVVREIRRNMAMAAADLEQLRQARRTARLERAQR